MSSSGFYSFDEMVNQPKQGPRGAARGKAGAPVPRPDRRFYAQNQAFGRFGMRWFDPQLMPMAHFHGHIELNWLTCGGMNYVIDGRPVSIPAERLVMFWAGIPHRTTSVDRGPGE